MINIGTIIAGYEVIAMANGYVMAQSIHAISPEPYVVWQLSADGESAINGRYFALQEDAEWDFCGKAFEWFQDNIHINYIEDDNEEQIADLEGYLSTAHTAIMEAAELVEELFAEQSDRDYDENPSVEPVEKVAKEFAAKIREQLKVKENAPQGEAAEHKIAIQSAENIEETLKDIINTFLSEYRKAVDGIDDDCAAADSYFLLRSIAARIWEHYSKSVVTNIWNFNTLFL